MGKALPPICYSSAVKDFVIVPLHTTPETSVKEMDELVDVYMDVKRRWKVEVRAFVLVPFPTSGRMRGQSPYKSLLSHNLILGFSSALSILLAKAAWTSPCGPWEFMLCYIYKVHQYY